MTISKQFVRGTRWLWLYSIRLNPRGSEGETLVQCQLAVKLVISLWLFMYRHVQGSWVWHSAASNKNKNYIIPVSSVAVLRLGYRHQQQSLINIAGIQCNGWYRAVEPYQTFANGDRHGLYSFMIRYRADRGIYLLKLHIHQGYGIFVEIGP